MSERNGRRIRILYYVPGLEVGGTEKNVHDLALGLPRDRFEVAVMWSCVWGPLGDNLVRAGIPVHQLPVNQAPRLQEVVAGIAEFRPDIFHSFSYRKEDRDVRAAREAGVPVILTSRGDLRFWDPEQTMKAWEPYRNEGTRRITVCSEAIAEVVRRVEGVAAEKIRVIHNGVELPEELATFSGIRQELGIGSDQPVFGYAGNYRKEKGHETLLAAFRRVHALYPLARLICCGGGHVGVKPRLEAMVADLGLTGSVSLLDLQSNVGLFYRSLDFYIHPSDTEGFSNALVEAMAYELPIIATRVGGCPEAIEEGVTGLLVPARDPISMSEAMNAFLEDSELTRRLAKAARERVKERFLSKHMLGGYVRLYDEELAALAGREME